MALEMYERHAKSNSYDSSKTRSLNDVKNIVMHYTGNKGDTAKNNVDYFATSNTREAGAHFFVDTDGNIGYSINMNRIAWAVGGSKYTDEVKKGGGTYYGKCTNANSISIELCNCINGVSWKQMVATRQLVLYIQKKCPNAKNIIRHWDVNGKPCPAPMTGTNNKKWKYLHNYLTKRYQYRAKVIKNAAIRSSKGVKPNNKIGSKKVGDIVCVTKVVGNWGRLKNKSADGKWRWITLSKVKEI